MIRAKDGRRFKLLQYANDWISGEPLEGGRQVIFNPTAVRVTQDELDEMKQDQHAGMFWEWFKPVYIPTTNDFRFSRRASR